MRLRPHAPARWFRTSASPTSPAPDSGPSPPRRFLPLWILTLGALEVSPDGRRPALSLPGRLGQELADYGQTLAGNVPEPVAAAGLVLARHEAEVAAAGLGVRKAVRGIDERSYHLGGARTDARDSPQLRDG